MFRDFSHENQKRAFLDVCPSIFGEQCNVLQDSKYNTSPASTFKMGFGQGLKRPPPASNILGEHSMNEYLKIKGEKKKEKKKNYLDFK